MKGHIFNLLEDFLIEVAGISSYETILEQCQFPTDTGFIRTVNYPDEQLNELVEHAVAHLGITTSQAHFSFGQWILPHLAALVPEQMLDHAHPGEFLKTVDYIHRVELKKLYPDASPPGFEYREQEPGVGVLTYNSPRAMFNLVEGVLQGVADYFDTAMDVVALPRPERGPGCCEFVITYAG